MIHRLLIILIILNFFSFLALAAEKDLSTPSSGGGDDPIDADGGIRELLLDAAQTKLDRVDIDAKRQNEHRSLDKSYYYRREYTNLISLERFIEITPGLLDAPVYNGVYNLNYRGINTSPLSGAMPFTMNVNGYSFDDAKTAPHYIYLIPDIGLTNFARQLESQDKTGRAGTLYVNTSKAYSNTFFDLTMGSDFYMDPSEQRAYMKLAAPMNDNKTSFYGLDLNFINHPGTYENKTDTFSDPEKFDELRDYYANLYFVAKKKKEGETRFELTFFNQDRNLVQGGMVNTANFYDSSSISDAPPCHTSSASSPCSVRNASNYNPKNKNSNGIINIEGIQFSGAYDFIWNLTGYAGTLDQFQDVDMVDVPISSWGAEMTKENYIGIADIDFNFMLRPLDTKKSNIIFGGNLGFERQTAKDVNSKLSFNQAVIGDVLYTNDYDEDTYSADIYLDFVTTNKDNVKFDIGVLGRLYYVDFSQQGNINDPNNALIYINSILSSIGARTYQAGSFVSNMGYGNIDILPRMMVSQTTYRKKEGVYDTGYFELFANSTSGGFNENYIRGAGASTEGYYKPEMVYTSNLGYMMSDVVREFKMEFFFNYLKDIHYLSAHQGFDQYYGNAGKGYATGLELSYKERVRNDMQVNISSVFTYSRYTEFTDHYYTDNGGNEYTADYSGKAIVNTPRAMLNFNWVYWNQPSGFFFRLDNTYVGKYYFDYANQYSNSQGTNGGYNNLGLALGYDGPEFVFEFYGTNLLNQDYIQGAGGMQYNNAGSAMSGICASTAGCTPFGWTNYAYQTIGLPLTIGVNFTYKIDDVKR